MHSNLTIDGRRVSEGERLQTLISLERDEPLPDAVQEFRDFALNRFNAGDTRSWTALQRLWVAAQVARREAKAAP